MCCLIVEISLVMCYIIYNKQVLTWKNMFKRDILNKLKHWSENKNRKPLVLRGARQVGKTTAVEMFANQYDIYISLNLDLREDKEIFDAENSLENTLEAICFLKGVRKTEISEGKTLLFIDEIQNSPQAVSMLRYFYEDLPELHVIAAGSLLESMLNTEISFPVGRVEFLVMHPLSFKEFLWAIKEEQAAELLKKVPIPSFAHEKMLKLFHRYTLIGGMPEIIKIYCDQNDLTELSQVYESLISAYLEDVEKYSSSKKLTPVIRHVIKTAFYEVSSRIKYGGFGNSNYKAKEIKEALMILQKAFLFQVIHPTTSTILPIYPDLKKAPRLQILDTGLVNYFAGIQKALFTSSDISVVYSGKILEHMIGQELFALSNMPLYSLNFWVREKSQSNAEIDYLIQVDNDIIPIEVKSGSSGRLRSLHSFIDNSSVEIAVRFYSGNFNVENLKTVSGKKFKLLNIPYYQVSMIEDYLKNAKVL